jgi:carbon storage regulator CsrA
MLVLSRRPNEKIIFPASDVSIEVLAIKAGAVRLGIDAPPDVTILREELVCKGRRETEAALHCRQDRPRTRLAALEQLLEKRLGIAETGLALLRDQLLAGSHPDVLVTLDELQEELRLLQDRVRKETGIAFPDRQGKTIPKRRALLVEDNPQERELMALFLRSEGIDVDTAGDGYAALDCLQARGRPDVVLLDMGLPRLDGPTTVREIRSNPACAGLKIFAVTGHSAAEFNIPVGPAGVDGWFQKPVDPITLVENLTREFEHSSGGV